MSDVIDLTATSREFDVNIVTSNDEAAIIIDTQQQPDDRPATPQSITSAELTVASAPPVVPPQNDKCNRLFAMLCNNEAGSYANEKYRNTVLIPATCILSASTVHNDSNSSKSHSNNHRDTAAVTIVYHSCFTYSHKQQQIVVPRELSEAPPTALLATAIRYILQRSQEDVYNVSDCAAIYYHNNSNSNSNNSSKSQQRQRHDAQQQQMNEQQLSDFIDTYAQKYTYEQQQRPSPVSSIMYQRFSMYVHPLLAATHYTCTFTDNSRINSNNTISTYTHTSYNSHNQHNNNNSNDDVDDESNDKNNGRNSSSHSSACTDHSINSQANITMTSLLQFYQRAYKINFLSLSLQFVHSCDHRLYMTAIVDAVFANRDSSSSSDDDDRDECNKEKDMQQQKQQQQTQLSLRSRNRSNVDSRTGSGSNSSSNSGYNSDDSSSTSSQSQSGSRSDSSYSDDNNSGSSNNTHSYGYQQPTASMFRRMNLSGRRKKQQHRRGSSSNSNGSRVQQPQPDVSDYAQAEIQQLLTEQQQLHSSTKQQQQTLQQRIDATRAALNTLHQRQYDAIDAHNRQQNALQQQQHDNRQHIERLRVDVRKLSSEHAVATHASLHHDEQQQQQKLNTSSTEAAVADVRSNCEALAASVLQQQQRHDTQAAELTAMHGVRDALLLQLRMDHEYVQYIQSRLQQLEATPAAVKRAEVAAAAAAAAGSMSSTQVSVAEVHRARLSLQMAKRQRSIAMAAAAGAVGQQRSRAASRARAPLAQANMKHSLVGNK